MTEKNVVRMNTKITQDYTFNRQAAIRLVNAIKAYWTHRGFDYKVWIEPEKINEDTYIYNIRSNINLNRF